MEENIKAKRYSRLEAVSGGRAIALEISRCLQTHWIPAGPVIFKRISMVIFAKCLACHSFLISGSSLYSTKDLQGFLGYCSPPFPPFLAHCSAFFTRAHFTFSASSPIPLPSRPLHGLFLQVRRLHSPIRPGSEVIPSEEPYSVPSTLCCKLPRLGLPFSPCHSPYCTLIGKPV